MDKFLTKTDNVINHTAVKIAAADRMKLLSETFAQGFAKTFSWMIDTKHFFCLSLIEAKLSFSWLNKDLFVGHNIVQSRTIDVFYCTICPPNPAQFKFFSCTLSDVHVHVNKNVEENLKTQSASGSQVSNYM